MADDWIKFRCNLHEEPEVLAMSNELGMDVYAVTGRLGRFWGWCSAHLRDGNADVTPVRYVDALTACAGFAEALENVGWLVPHDGPDGVGFTVPKWENYLSQGAKQRAVTARRVQRHRRRECNDSRNGRTVTKPLPEKRREEDTSSSLSREEEDSPEPENQASGQAFLTFPCSGKVKEWHYTEAKLAEHQEAFPGVDCRAEARKALQWIRDNPSRRKTARGYCKFLYSWYERTQNRGRRSPEPRAGGGGVGRPGRVEPPPGKYDGG